MAPPNENYVSYSDGGQTDGFALEKAVQNMNKRIRLLTVRCMSAASYIQQAEVQA
jgi:hypothetical protein